MIPRASRLIITSGEPSGIGPDLCLAMAALDWDCEVIVLADPDLLTERAAQLGQSVRIALMNPAIDQVYRHQPGQLWVDPVTLAEPVKPGVPKTANAPYVLKMLDRAISTCQTDQRTAMVTAPIQKSIINEAGIAFSGHTEYLQKQCGVSKVVMMLAGPGIRVALATTHLPLRAVADAITPGLLREVVTILDHDLRYRFGIPNPRIGMCGLNPHAGESGHLGHEEQDILRPLAQTMRQEGFDLSDPLPADTLFIPAQRSAYDAILAMYHDQGLPVLKYMTFGHGINITLGLPIIRTSVDHGTALDRAGKGNIDSGSMQAAMSAALELLSRSTPS